MTQVAVREDNAVVTADARSIMEVISRAAADPKTDVDKLKGLLDLYERITARQAETTYSEAMNTAQEAMGPVSQDASNPQTRSKYASFGALDKAIRPIYTRHGFSLSFDTGDAPENHVRVICNVAHKAGHSKRPHVDMPCDGKGAKGGDVMTKTHATMAAISYGKRGLLKMIFNIAEGDDDGNGASAPITGAISLEQAETIFDIIKRTKADTAKFCKYMGVPSVPDIAAKDYEKAIVALNTTAARKAAQ